MSWKIQIRWVWMVIFGMAMGVTAPAQDAKTMRRIDLEDGMTISFHHHFREGDKVVNLVMEEIAAMGIKKTVLPYIVFLAGLTGTAAGILLQWWTNAFDYPFLISGKPLFSLPANIPVAFETTILFAAISALVGMLALNGLPQLSHPLHANRSFKSVTDDRFFISIEARDPLFDAAKTRELLQSISGQPVEEVEELS